MLFHQNVKQTVFEEYKVVFVHPCPEEGSVNMRLMLQIHPRPSFKDIISRSLVPMYR